MAVQGANHKHYIGWAKAKKLIAKNNSTSNNTLNGSSETKRMLHAMEKENELKEIAHYHCLLQKQASFWLKLGDKEKIKEYTILNEEEQKLSVLIPTKVNVVLLGHNDDGLSNSMITHIADDIALSVTGDRSSKKNLKLI